jgi:transcriptional regulator with XRE-family HTH domain
MLNETEKKEFWQLLKRIGINLRRARQKRGRSQEEMSEIIGVSYRQYQKLEHGDRPLSMRNLFRISRRSKIPIKELVQ